MGYHPGHGASKRKTPKNPNSKAKSKPKKQSKKTIQKRPRQKQTRIPFERMPVESPPSTPPRPPCAGGRVEQLASPSTSFVSVVVQTPSRSERYVYQGASRMQFKDLAPNSPSGPSAQKSGTVTPPLVTTPSTAILSDSPTPLPENLRSKSKRKFQSRIDDLFLPLSSSPGGTKDCPLHLDDGSESEGLSDIQLETENPSEPPISPDSDTDSDDIVGPRARRQRYLPSSPALGRPQTPPLRTHDSENEPSQDQDSEDELSQELRDITSSAQKVRVERRTRGNESRNKRKSQFQKNLESLKRRKSTTQEESDEESVKARALYDSASDVDSVDSDHFVVEDEEDLTAEQLMEIPPEFTSVSYQGTQHNFKVVIQAEVYAILHPDYEFLDYSKHPIDPYFRHAWKSLERKIAGITDSAISSNAWKPWFVRALKARPEFESEEIPGDFTDCDACNVSKRHATYMVRLTGPKYNPRTLEIIAPSNERFVYWDDDNKQFLSEPDVDEQDLEEGDIIKINLNREWALGKFCHARAEIAHYFYHWRYNLREQVNTALRRIGYLSAEKKQHIRNLPSDLQYKALDEVMNLLDRKRHIARMYKEFKERSAMGGEYLTGAGKGWKSSPQTKRFLRI